MFILGHIGITIGIAVVCMYYLKDWKIDLDFRWLAFAAVLPDIIDKTIGLFLLRGYIDNGRIYAHTLLFVLIFTAIAFYFKSKLTTALGFGVWTHFVFDQMWKTPETMFWPAFGLGFPRIEFEARMWWEALFNNPYVYISEILGAIILIYLFFHFRLYKIDNFKMIFTKGRFPIA